MKMSANLELTVLIPAHNEEKRILSCLERLETFLKDKHPSSEIVISEDGSNDRTIQIVASFKERPDATIPIAFLHSDDRLGKGGGLKKGFQVARGTYTVFTDTDLPVPLETFTRAVDVLKSGADVVNGNRVMKGATRNEPLRRRVLSRGFHMLAHVLTGIPWDSQCGFKAARTQLGKEAFARIANPGFAYDVEFLLEARELGAKIVEIPVQWNYSQDTSMRLSKDVLGMFNELVHIFWQTRFNH